MIYVIIGLAVLLLVIGVVAFIFCKLYKKYRKDYELEHTRLIGLEQEYSNLIKAYEIKKNNKEKADEKIDEMHTGDSVANAINILRK